MLDRPLAALDAWIANQKEVDLSRPEAVRRLVELGLKKVTDDDPNEAYEVVPIEPGPRGPPKGWWTVRRNGLPIRHFPGKEKAERYATDPKYRASLVTVKAWEKAKGK